MTTFSFTSIPLGLGLSAAAHFHLCHRSLAQAECERQRRLEFSERCQIDIFIQSFSEKALVSEFINLLEHTLYIHGDLGLTSSNCDGHQNQESPLLRTNTSTATVSPRKQRTKTGVSNGPLSNNAAVPIATNLGPSSVNDCPMEYPTHYSLGQVELWIKACRELRLSQEKALQKTFTQTSMQARGEDSTFWALNTNIITSLLLGAVSIVRLFPSTSFWTRIFNSQRPAPILLGTSWQFISNSNSNIAGTIPTSLTPFTSSFSSSSFAAAFPFLPIIPTLFLSGAHLFVALRTRWTFHEIEQQTQACRKFAKRTKMLCNTLFLREQRLSYLLNQIKTHESDPLSTVRPLLGPVSESTLQLSGPLESVLRSNVLGRQRVNSCRDYHVIIPWWYRRRSCQVDDTIMAFTPDLQLLNIERILQDPVECSKIFKTELEALRQELIVFLAESR